MVSVLVSQLKDLHAPPGRTRRIGIQEVETVLCKYKSHTHGRYAVGKDIEETYHSLAGMGDLAGQMLKSTPKAVDA